MKLAEHKESLAKINLITAKQLRNPTQTFEILIKKLAPKTYWRSDFAWLISKKNHSTIEHCTFIITSTKFKKQS